MLKSAVDSSCMKSARTMSVGQDFELIRGLAVHDWLQGTRTPLQSRNHRRAAAPNTSPATTSGNLESTPEVSKPALLDVCVAVAADDRTMVPVIVMKFSLVVGEDIGAVKTSMEPKLVLGTGRIRSGRWNFGTWLTRLRRWPLM